MKKLTLSLITISLVLFATSCGVNSALVVNHNQNSTQVHLSENNYKIVEKVVGSSEVEYVLFFGGMNKKHLYENAYSNMVNTANLSGSKALINVLTEEQLSGVPPFYYKRTVTVSAHIIEFIK